ncbi:MULTISPECIES: Ger(x)C family spore germination protein [Clostridium]|uniref:Predicted spore germination protein n=2 Tax=Clostridium TaxID=1485 RepID=D8GU49_CLOLD|nr:MULTISPECIES: Ger(x)C family spore germination protein [Clostridium]ADK14712.1 predicted spore germination protein [Clostridium ljungdahlii DSM 13528]OAA85949.1 Spore germination protein A3 precursor [Clostridium ljungdahlii DSM 13528]RMC99978.1 Ger(x)C family spore germination protein [Clostridium autoethanogenum]
MKKYINLAIKIVVCILVALNLTSCFGSHELNKLAIVVGVGLDKGKQDDYPIEMTVQVANASGIKDMSKSKDNESRNTGYLNLREKGKSISDATKAFNRKLNRHLFFSHNQVVIFGKDMAGEGIEKYMDFFLRYRETRILTWILISKQPASEILNAKPELEATPGRNIGELIKNQQEVSQVPAVNLKDFSSKLISKTTSPIAPIVEISNDNNKKIVYLSKTAVFKKGKMVGSLNEKESRGLLWCTNKMKDGIVSVDTSNKDSNSKVSIATTHTSSKIIPQIKDGKVSIQIKIKQEGDLQEQLSSEDLSNSKSFSILEKREEDTIKKEIMLALKKSKKLNADIFGFGDAIYQHYPKQWSKIEKNWEETFQNIPVNINVNAKIRRTGRITKSIMSRDN